MLEPFSQRFAGRAREVEARSAPIPVEPVGDVMHLLPVLAQGEVDEGPLGGDELHRGAEAALDDRRAAAGEVLEEVVDVRMLLEPCNLG